MTFHTHAALVGVAAVAILSGLSTRADCGQGPSTVSPPLPVPATAANLEAERATTKLKNADVDLGVPESPAFVAAGFSPDTIVRPTTPREFATALLNGVDREGHLQTGVAVDTAPYLVYAGSKVSLRDYRQSRMTQVLSRTQASFASTKGAGDKDPSVRLAVGFHSTLYDSEDPRLNNDLLLQCYSEIPVLRITDLGVNLSSEEREKATELAREQFERTVLKPRTEQCRERFRRQARWNGTSWIVAAATIWTSPTGLTADLDGGSFALWTSFSYGFDGVPGLRDRAQAIAHVHHRANEVVVDKDLPGGQEVRDTTIAGGRLRAGTSSMGLSFEAAYARSSAASRATDSFARLSFIAERRLAENLWLNVSFSGDAAADQGTSHGMSVLSAFKYAFTKDPTLTAAQR